MATIGSVIGGHLPAGSQRREGNARTQIPVPDARKGLQDIRALGLWSYRDRSVAATASAHGSISFCCRRNAILRGKISGGADARPNCSILPARVRGSALWPAIAHDGHVATWTAGPHRGCRPDCSGDHGSHFRSSKEISQASTQLGD